MTTQSDNLHGRCVTALASPRGERELSRAMCNADGACDAGWRGAPLAVDCPPTDAKSPGGETYFRWIGKADLSEKDFATAFSLDRHTDAPLCLRQSVSVWNDRDYMVEALKWPSKKNKRRVAAIALTANAGVVKQTGKPNHFSWWRCGRFDAAAHTTVEAA